LAEKAAEAATIVEERLKFFKGKLEKTKTQLEDAEARTTNYLHQLSFTSWTRHYKKKRKKKEGEITLYPLKYPPICTFNFEVSSMTLNPPKLSNCGNSTPLAFLFPKCPHPKIKKTKNQKKMLRWPGGGSATPRPAVWGWPNHPLGPWGARKGRRIAL
jgi:hypothetical protein